MFSYISNMFTGRSDLPADTESTESFALVDTSSGEQAGVLSVNTEAEKESGSVEQAESLAAPEWSPELFHRSIENLLTELPIPIDRAIAFATNGGTSSTWSLGNYVKLNCTEDNLVVKVRLIDGGSADVVYPLAEYLKLLEKRLEMTQSVELLSADETPTTTGGIVPESTEIITEFTETETKNIAGEPAADAESVGDAEPVDAITVMLEASGTSADAPPTTADVAAGPDDSVQCCSC